MGTCQVCGLIHDPVSPQRQNWGNESFSEGHVRQGDIGALLLCGVSSLAGHLVQPQPGTEQLRSACRNPVLGQTRASALGARPGGDPHASPQLLLVS